MPMQIGDFTWIEDYGEALFDRMRKAVHIIQLKSVKDPKYIRQSTQDYLFHFSNQIISVEKIKMAHLEDGFIPRKLNQWLKKSKDLKSQVRKALDERQKGKDELKKMCDQMFDNMRDCPIEEANEKQIAFIAVMQDTVSFSSLQSDDDVLQLHANDVVDKEEVTAPCAKDGIHAITFGGGVASILESSFGDSILELRSEYSLTSEIMHEGETSQAHDSFILDISSKGSNSPYIVQIREEGDGSRPSRHGKKPIGESELGMMVQILVDCKMSDYVDLIRLEVLNMSYSHATLNNAFGLRQDTDNYFFSAVKKGVELEVDTDIVLASLPQDLIVNKSGPLSEEMPTDQQWSEAAVANLTERKTRHLNEEPNCPNLVILFLQRNNRLLNIHHSFFKQMPALRFLDLSDTRIKALPSSLFDLTNLQVLLLRSCVCLHSLPSEIKTLKNMEVLDLLETDLSSLPKEIAQLTRLRYLQLTFNTTMLLADVFELKALEGLSIAVRPNDQHWANTVRDVMKQVDKLEMLSYLRSYFPSVEDLQYFCEVSLTWREQRLRSFEFLVGHNIKRIISRVPQEVESEYKKYDRCLRFVNGSEVPRVMKRMLEHVTAFYLDRHLEIRSLTELGISNFRELKFCVVRECPNVQVITTREETTDTAFPQLEYLGLHYLWKLERIWEDCLPQGSYQALKYLMVSTCGKLEYIASHHVLECLYNLETLVIEDCESLKLIVQENENVEYDDAPSLLPRLKELVLRHLPQLVALGRGLFPSKEIITINFCPRLDGIC